MGRREVVFFVAFKHFSIWPICSKEIYLFLPNV